LKNQSNATLYIANQRVCTQEDWFRSFHTFNAHTDKQSFGALQILNDETLAGNKQFSKSIETATNIILLPIVGTISVKLDLPNEVSNFTTSPKSDIINPKFTEGGYVNVGQSLVFSATQNSSFDIANPYETELVNYLQIGLIYKTSTERFLPFIKIFSFDLEKHKNQLLPLCSSENEDCLGFIGQYKGRAEDIYRLKKPENGVFVFIIEGAFEVQNRLLESRDGLALLDVEEVEFEALSDEAVLIILEVSC
jgi:quercetin 2,3-dioxygenase